MQKLEPQSTMADRALRILRNALPPDVVIEELKGARPEVTLGAPGIEPIALRLVRSEEGAAPDGSTGVVVLRASGPHEHERLRQQGASFIDLSGVVHLRAPGLYVDRTDLEAAARSITASGGGDPYSDTASRVVRVLLEHPSTRRWSTSELAEASEVDVSTASRVAHELRHRELVVDEAPGQGRASRIGVVDPLALLHDWVRRYSWSDNRQLRVAAPIGSVSKFIDRMPDLLAGRRWALSLHAGASLIAPHAQFDLVHVYVEGSTEALAFERGFDLSESGRLVLLEPVYRRSVWFHQERVEKAPVVSTVQLVLDLWHYPVRGREQAEHLVERVLRPVWEGDEGA